MIKRSGINGIVRELDTKTPSINIRNQNNYSNTLPSYALQKAYNESANTLVDFLSSHESGTALDEIEKQTMTNYFINSGLYDDKDYVYNNLGAIIKQHTGVDIDKGWYRAWEDAGSAWDLSKKYSENWNKMKHLDVDSQEYKDRMEYSEKLQRAMAIRGTTFKSYGWLGNTMIEDADLTAQLLEQSLTGADMLASIATMSWAAGGILGMASGTGFLTGGANMLNAAYGGYTAAEGATQGLALTASGIPYVVGAGEASAAATVMTVLPRIKIAELSYYEAGSKAAELSQMTDKDGNHLTQKQIAFFSDLYGAAIFGIENELVSIIHPLAAKLGVSGTLDQTAKKLEAIFESSLMGHVGGYLYEQLGESVQEIGEDEAGKIIDRFAMAVSDWLNGTKFSEDQNSLIRDIFDEAKKGVKEYPKSFITAGAIPGLATGGMRMIQSTRFIKPSVQKSLKETAKTAFTFEANRDGVLLDASDIDTMGAWRGAPVEGETTTEKHDIIPVIYVKETGMYVPLHNEDRQWIANYSVSDEKDHGVMAKIVYTDTAGYTDEIINLTEEEENAEEGKEYTPNTDLTKEDEKAPETPETEVEIKNDNQLDPDSVNAVAREFESVLRDDGLDVLGTDNGTVYVNNTESIDEARAAAEAYGLFTVPTKDGIKVYGGRNEKGFTFTVKVSSPETRIRDNRYIPIAERDTSNLSPVEYRREQAIEYAFNSIKAQLGDVKDSIVHSGAIQTNILSETMGIPVDEILDKGIVMFQTAKSDDIASYVKGYNKAHPDAQITKDDIKGWMTPGKVTDETGKSRDIYVVNVTDTADETTLLHEVGHVMRAMATPEMLSGFVGLEGFTGEAGAMWRSDIREENGKYYLGDREFDSKKEAVEAVRNNEELFVDLLLEYEKTGNVPNTEVKNFFDKLVDFMKKVYRYIKSELSPKTKAAFDTFFSTKTFEQLNETENMSAKEWREWDKELGKRINDDITAEDMPVFQIGERPLAPNGKLSNLSPRLWNVVRTPAFKAWFGDWEKDSANASKIVDENGEPKVMYRGQNWQESDVSGIFVTEAEDFAKHYGQVAALFINSRNPFNGINDAESLREFVEQNFEELQNEYYNFFEDDDDNYQTVDDLMDALKENWWISYEMSDLIQKEIYSRGYDSIAIQEDYTPNIMVKYANQIKSVDNTGSFNPDNDSILFQTEEFKNWFKQSKVVDANGRPLKVFHGTTTPGFTQFDTDSKANGGEGDLKFFTDNAEVASQFAIETRPLSAFSAVPTGNAGGVYPVYLSMQNPLDFRNLTDEQIKLIARVGEESKRFGGDAEYIEKDIRKAIQYNNDQLAKFYAMPVLERLSEFGYDGMIARMGYFNGIEDAVEYAVVNNNQIKSVFNNGAYSLSDDILMQAAYHGSGADFDRFLNEYINTGEGAQAFGYGHYVTSSDKIGKLYAKNITRSKNRLLNAEIDTLRRMLDDDEVQIQRTKDAMKTLDSSWLLKANGFKDNDDDGHFFSRNADGEHPGVSIHRLSEGVYEVDSWETGLPQRVYKGSYNNVVLKAVELVDGRTELTGEEKAQRDKSAEIAQKTIDFLSRDWDSKSELLREKIAETTDRHLYKVEIPDEDDGIHSYINWDGRLGEGTLDLVLDRLKEWYDEYGVEEFYDWEDKVKTGHELYRTLSHFFEFVDETALMDGKISPFNEEDNYNKIASEFLSDLGFTGIKYKAGQVGGVPRGAEGAYNYVIFDPNDIVITNHWQYSTDEEADAFFQLSAQKLAEFQNRRAELIEPYKNDIQRAIELNEYVADEYIEYFKDEQWAADELLLRQILKKHPESAADARNYDSADEWLATMENIPDHLIPRYRRIYDLAHMTTPEQEDRIFLVTWTTSDTKILQLANILRSYRTKASARQQRATGNTVTGQFGAYKGVSTKLLRLRDRNGSTSSGNEYQRSTHEEIEEVRKLIEANPRAYREAYLKAYGANDYANHDQQYLEYGVENLNYRLDQLFGKIDAEQAKAEHRQELIDSGNTAQLTIEDLQDQIARANEDLKDLKVDTNATIKELNEKLEKVDRDYQNAETWRRWYAGKLNEARKENAQNEKEINAKNEKIDKLNQKLSESREKANNLKKEKDKALRAKNAMQRKIDLQEQSEKRIQTMKKIVDMMKFSFDRIDASYENMFAWVRGLFDYNKEDRQALETRRRELLRMLDAESIDTGTREKIQAELEEVRQQINASDLVEIPEELRVYFANEIGNDTGYIFDKMMYRDNRQSKWSQEELDFILNRAQIMKMDAQAMLESKKLARSQRLTQEAGAFFKQTYGKEVESFIKEDVTKFEAYNDTHSEKADNFKWLTKIANAMPDRLAREIDGGREGVAYNRFIRKAWNAMFQEYKYRNQRIESGRKKFKELELSAKKLNKKGLSYTKDNGTTIELTRGQMIGVYVYGQSDLGMDKLSSKWGNGITPVDVNKIVSNLTKAEKAWGDFLLYEMGSQYNRIADVFYNVYNQKLGQRDAYFPLVAAGKIVEGVGDILTGAQGTTVRYTDKGFTKAANPYAIYALDLNVTDTWLQQVQRQEHFMAYAEWARDTNYLLGRGGIGDTIKQKYGKNKVENLQHFTNFVGSPQSKLDKSERIMNNLLGAYGASKVIGNFSAMFKQLPTIAGALVGDVSLKNFVKSVFAPSVSLEAFFEANNLLDPDSDGYEFWKDFIYSNDPQMKNRRLGGTFLGDINDTAAGQFGNIRNQVTDEISKYTLSLTDGFVTSRLWLACYMTTYEKLKKTMTPEAAHEEARFKASRLISQTQNTALRMDLSENLRAAAEGKPWQKMVFMFGSATMNIFNQIFYDIPYFWNSNQKKRAIATILNVVINMASMMAIGGAFFRKKDEDDEEYWKRILIKELPAQIITNTLPGFGTEIANKYRGYSGASTMSLFEDIGMAASEARNGKVWEALIDIASSLMGASGYPVQAVEKGVKGIINLNPGYLMNKSWADWYEENVK